MLIITFGIALDLSVVLTGRPKPPATGGQVPREWSRLFPTEVVAALYGARLGIGPLTMLSTWGWWSATVASAVMGLGPAAVVGATFGFVRMSTVAGFSLVAGGRSQAERFGRLRARQRPGRLTLNGLGLLAVASVVIVGCSGGPLSESAQTTRTKPTLRSMALTMKVDQPQPRSSESRAMPNLRSSDDALPPVGSDTAATTTPVTAPARLEDFVRSSPPDQTAEAVAPITDLPESLAEVLLRSIDGFASIADPVADRFLDLKSAADLQPDPSGEVALLETRGFRGGWTRAFRNSANDVAVAAVYHFDNAAQAEFYLEDGLITIGGYGGHFFDIEGLPGVRGFTQSFQDGEESLLSLGAAFQEGPRWYLVYFVGSPQTVTSEILIPTVLAQRATAADHAYNPTISSQLEVKR